MPRGGKRTGAGRRPGNLTKKTTEVAGQAAKEGITPLEVMIKVMRRHYDEGKFDAAASVAKDAAPYMHPRLASIEVGGPNGGAIPVAMIHEFEALRKLPPDELIRRYRQSLGASGQAQP